MGKTLWEMLRAKAAGPVELQIENPLKLKCGTAVTIKEIDLKDLTFYVKKVSEYNRNVGGVEFKFTDYDLMARPFGGEDVEVKLRLNPMGNPDKYAGLTHNVVLLKKYDDIAYDEGLHNVVKDTTKIFEVSEGDVVTERYYRINDVQDSYKADVTSVKEGCVSLEDVERLKLEYWDYWRTTQDEAGQDYNQYMFVEMNTDNGWFQLWRGEEITPECVTVI